LNFADGQAIANRIARTLKRTSTSLQKQVTAYNSCDFTSTDLPAHIDIKEVSNLSSDLHTDTMVR